MEFLKDTDLGLAAADSSTFLGDVIALPGLPGAAGVEEVVVPDTGFMVTGCDPLRACFSLPAVCAFNKNEPKQKIIPRGNLRFFMHFVLGV